MTPESQVGSASVVCGPDCDLDQVAIASIASGKGADRHLTVVQPSSGGQALKVTTISNRGKQRQADSIDLSSTGPAQIQSLRAVAPSNSYSGKTGLSAACIEVTFSNGDVSFVNLDTGSVVFTLSVGVAASKARVGAAVLAYLKESATAISAASFKNDGETLLLHNTIATGTGASRATPVEVRVAGISVQERGHVTQSWAGKVQKLDGGSQGLSVLVQFEDDSLALFNGDRLQWLREEALIGAEGAIVFDGVADSAGAPSSTLESEDNTVGLDLTFAGRLQLQKQDLLDRVDGVTKLFRAVMAGDLGSVQFMDTSNSYGLDKTMVVTVRSAVTGFTKLVALQLQTGQPIWSLVLPTHLDALTLTSLRTEALRLHSFGGFPPEMAVFATYMDSGMSAPPSTVVLTVNALTGRHIKQHVPAHWQEVAEVAGAHLLPAPVAVVPLATHDSSMRTALVIVEANHGSGPVGHVFPTTDAAIASVQELVNSQAQDVVVNWFNKRSNELVAMQLQAPSDAGEIELVARWSIVVGDSKSRRVVAFAQQTIRDYRTELPAEARGDDSLAVKYLHPHLAAVALFTSHSNDESDDVEKSAVSGSLEVLLLDTVTGHVLSSNKHTKTTDEVSMVLKGHQLVYTFWSIVARRQEVVASWMFAGEIGKKELSPVSRWPKAFKPDGSESELAFSSYRDHAMAPVVIDQTFILPSVSTTYIHTERMVHCCGRRLGNTHLHPDCLHDLRIMRASNLSLMCCVSCIMTGCPIA